MAAFFSLLLLLQFFVTVVVRSKCRRFLLRPHRRCRQGPRRLTPPAEYRPDLHPRRRFRPPKCQASRLPPRSLPSPTASRGYMSRKVCLGALPAEKHGMGQLALNAVSRSSSSVLPVWVAVRREAAFCIDLAQNGIDRRWTGALFASAVKQARQAGHQFDISQVGSAFGKRPIWSLPSAECPG